MRRGAVIGGEENHQHFTVFVVGEAVSLTVDAGQGKVRRGIADLQITDSFLGPNGEGDDKHDIESQAERDKLCWFHKAAKS